MILACGGWTSVSWEGLFGGLADLLLLTGKQVLGVFTPLIVGAVVVGALALAALALRAWLHVRVRTSSAD